MGFFGIPLRVAQVSKGDQSKATEESENSTQSRRTYRAETVGKDAEPHEDGEYRPRNLNRFRGKRETSQNREHQGEENEEEPERSPVAVAGADTDFTKEPAQAANIKKAEGKGIHTIENDSGWESFKSIITKVATRRRESGKL